MKQQFVFKKNIGIKQTKECIMCGSAFLTYVDGKKGHRGNRNINYNVRKSNCVTYSRPCAKRYMRLLNIIKWRIKSNLKNEKK